MNQVFDMWTPSRLYSQNFEDLYLYRLFSGVDKGFYIDAGAWLPRVDSVTAIFYDQGWRGVNIEPVKEVFDILSSERSQDINLCLAVVENPSTQTIPMLLASEDPVASGQHHAIAADSSDSAFFFDGQAGLAKRDVRATTLREIVEKYASSQRINFLKLDVEGFEYKALLGLDLKSLAPSQRPEVILLEATLPDTRLSAPHRQQCREYLLDNSYQFLFYDGLNDYYCLVDLYEDFAPKMIPPNVFDRPAIVASQIFANAERLGVVSRDCADLREQLTVSQGKLAAQVAVLEQERRARQEAEKSLAEAEATLSRVSGSLRQLVQR
jgi:FkbM family methyltransferase